jgi:pSer/pThr/pTyr-binding forkhead associated (FHA) protein
MVSTGFLEIRIADTGEVVAQVDLPGVEGYTLGRSDASSTFVPDIDLAASGARDKGVSRRHAVLVRYHGAVHVVDLESVNGTFLNGERLLPNVPYPVKDGDQLSVASLNLTIGQIMP